MYVYTVQGKRVWCVFNRWCVQESNLNGARYCMATVLRYYKAYKGSSRFESQH